MNNSGYTLGASKVTISGTTVVPEPASAAMLLAPGALMAIRRRRRN